MREETELQMVRRHVREGRRNVRRQRELVLSEAAEGRDTKTAELLLGQFEAIQAEHIAHLARIRRRAP